ncbi:hypothetical protein KKE60_04330 [Patescibacteria group bacterium]|nr:hypothetical protein [Patescibacteria group bacterium]
MTDVISLLPLLDGWRYDPMELAGVVCLTKREIVRVTQEKGWCLWVLATIDNPNAIMTIIADKYSKADVTAFELNAAGLDEPNASGFWVGAYNILPGVYNVFYTPLYPQAYKNSIILAIEPPAGETVIILGYAHLLIRIDDQAAFEKSLRRVLGK